VPHGLRSTFTDWAGDYADATTDLTEMALAHAIADKTRAAYRRRSAFDKRRALMEQWSTFCSTPYLEPESAEIIQLQTA
jgi:integrase